MKIQGTNIYLTRGDDISLTFNISTTKPIFITELAFTVKKKAYSEEILLQKTALTYEEEEIDENNFIYSFSLDIKPTKEVFEEFGEYRYDVQIKYRREEEGEEITLTIIKPSIFAVMEEVN